MLVATANVLDRYMNFKGAENHAAALKRLVIEKIGRHPLEHINALKQVVASLK